ncbi:MAG TPA: transglutaminase, partial [Croceibacterium sp.]|nr:transglutaminase [Croceibacterium sp.]
YRYDVPSRASVLTISGTWTVDWDDDGDGKRSLSLPGGGFSPPERRLRAAEQDQDVPFYKAPDYDCNVTTVRVPSATKLANWSVNSAYDTEYFGGRYHRAFEKRDGTIRMIRGFRVQRPEISAAAARADNSRVGQFDNSMAWIYYDAKNIDSAISKGVRVPAVNEIDWTTEDAACLPGEFSH